MKRIHLLLFSLLALLLFPSKNYGQITLGAAASQFTIFTASGAVGDNAVAHSHVTGDVGSSTPGPITGFGNVDGVMHPGADLATAACVSALSATIIQLNAATPTLFPAALLGNGATFTAGVYSIPGNATLSLNLFLDAQNVSGAEFIIKIGGTFGATTNAKVILVNGAKACHVYWQINGAVTLASLVTMRGNIISNGAINMGSGDSLEGRALTTVGLIGIDGITAFKPIGCNNPVLTGPTPPNAGSINCYTIFSSIGALQNSIGTSVVIGDVGKDNDGSSITGWTPGAVTGTLHSLRDASTIQCVTDLSKLYDTLNAMTPDITLLFPAQFGHDLTLSPHVYQMTSAATLTDSLYLDAQNNANAIFVIKIAGSLTTGTYAKVKLINGAQSKNVFWVIQGALNVNNYSVMRGTFIVPAGAINMVNTGIVLDGRALTMNGAITTQGLTATMSPGCGSTTIIIQPVSKTVCLGSPVYFNAKSSQPGVTYQWRKGNVNMVNSANISGATSDTLKILSATLADTSSFYYLLANGAIIDSTYKVSLRVNLPPTVITDPINKTVCLGDSIYFRVVATGTALTYQWLKDSIPLKDTLNISGSKTDSLKIKLIAISDTSSKYSVVVYGTCLPNDTSLLASLKLQTAPVITTEPINKTVCPNDSVLLTIKTTGSNLTYQWRKGNVNILNGINYTGTTSDSLKIKIVTALDTASNYNVIVTGACGLKDTSINAFVRLSLATSIVSQPANKSVCPGDSMFFTVKAIGTGLTYQWKKGLVNLSNSGNIKGATSDTLKINPVSILDTSSNYYVVVSSACAANISSNSVSLLLNKLPVVVTQPVNKSSCLGTAINFSVVASGTGVTYQWKKGNVNLVNGPNVSGATADTLKLTNISIADSSILYHVIISGACSPKDSSIYASLTVNTPPGIITEPINQLVCIGSATYFFIKESGNGLTYNWRKGNSSLINGINISGANKDTLRINNVSLLDTASNYNVIVTGLCGPSDTSVFVSLKTNTLPVILIQPSNQSVCLGNTAIFNVSAIGAGITYQWRKGNVDLVNSGLITGVTTDSLRILSATDADTSSFYNVVITGNCLTSVISNNAKLTVLPLPIAVAGGSLKVCVGNTLVLNTPNITGATYHWSGPNAFISSAQNPTIPNAQIGNSGIYSVFITVNGCNSIPATINIVVAVCITDLSTTKTVNNLKPLMGRKIIFTITAHNGGPDTAHNVVITDVLQSGYTYVSVTTTTGVYDNVTGAWNIGTMLNGASEVLTLTAIVKTSGIFTNTSNITGMEFDGDLSNNTSIVDPIPTDFNIPEGFSPNGDGINDLYVIRGIEYFPTNTFTIFNRWGNKVFEANPYKNTWDGHATTGIKVGGDMLPVGTYFYVIDLGDGSPVIKGTIYLNK